MDENKSGLKKDIVRMICISIILCGLLVLCFTFRSIASSTSGYESLAYTINAILTATLFVSCMFAWVICLIANGGKNKKKEGKV